MALKAIVEKLEEVAEGMREHYVEKGGKFEIQVEGLKTQADIDRVMEATRKEREDHAKTRERLKGWEGLEPEQVRTQLDRIQELETLAAGKFDETKIEPLVEGRIKGRIAPIERKLAEAADREKKKDELLSSYQAADRRRAIQDAIREAAVKMKVDPRSIPDAMLNAEAMLTVSEDGKRVVARDNVGVTPGIDPETWFSEMQQKGRPWWGVSAGGGANGSTANGGGSANPWSKDGWNVTAQGQFVRQHGEEKARSMAKSAGVDFDKPRRPMPKQ